MKFSPTVDVRFQLVEWILAESCNVLLFLATTYAGISLIAHGIRTEKWKNVDTLSKVTGRFYTAAVLPFFLFQLRLIFDQVVFNVGFNDTTAALCEFAMDASILAYMVTILSIYVFLWLRQRCLYQHPEIAADMGKKWLCLLNWAALAVILCGLAASGVAFTLPQNYKSSRRGCVSRPRGQFTSWPLYMCNGAVLLGQGLMLFLFFYPLRRHLRENSGERVTAILRRSSAFALVCVLSDFITMLLYVCALPEAAPRHVSCTLYNINLAINLLSVLLSFDDWRSIVRVGCLIQSCGNPN